MDIGEDAQCLIYFHGGAFCFPAAPYHKELALRYALEANCVVILPHYHLLPKCPFPAAQNDAIATYGWVMQNATMLGVSNENIAVGGDSAGAALSLALEQHAPHNISTQLLVYPLLDRSMQTISMITFTDTPLWNSKLNQKLWKMYLAKIPANLWDSASPITWPISTHPIRTYVETAEFDCLRDEGLDYADSLKDAGREIVVHQTRQTIHGYDMNLKSPITEESVQKRIAFLKESFKNNK